ncbi:MAG TPA: FecR family protein [Leptospiraceae bacterium]|nr:FecR family protein [Leptospiraceae bacterium]HNF12658.1 FecR family protein [Leptospiraceae bacterium]HNF24183.1 FecR family protein [Leptospiraceae bacterium]HNI96890.1 FecR family protein [Leptospiraceae bacterium]HNN02194.1 FecR family protein [Leptospiraceae bacterium]
MKKLYSVCLILALIVSCKEKNEQKPAENAPKADSSGLVLFVIGDVTNGGAKVKLGDTIKPKDLLKVGKKSICDMQIKGTEITMRVKELSEFSFESKTVGSKEDISAELQSGSAIFNVQKMKSENGFSVKTPAHVVGVRGTKFETSVTADGKSKTNVYEGKVAAKIRIKELENISEEELRKSKNLTALLDSVSNTEVVLEKGQSTVGDIKQAEKILKDTGLAEAVKNLDSAKVADIDTKIDPAKTLEKTAKIAKEAKPSVAAIPPADFEKKLKEYEEIIAVESSKLNDPNLSKTALTERAKQNEERILKRIEEITGKALEILVLKNGTKIKGVIYQEGDKYIILTSSGKEEYEAKDVEGTEFN